MSVSLGRLRGILALYRSRYVSLAARFWYGRLLAVGGGRDPHATVWHGHGEESALRKLLRTIPVHTPCAKLILRSLFPALLSSLPILSTAMPSKSILLVLLAAPCVVESAAALTFPKTSIDTFVESLALQTDVNNKKGLLSGSGSGYDAATCTTDLMKLYKDTAAESKACRDKCNAERLQTMKDLAGGKEQSAAAVCVSSDECKKLKEACHEKSPNPFWVGSETTIVNKGATAPMIDGTYSSQSGSCMPKTCAGMSMGGGSGSGVTGDTTIEAGAKSTSVHKMGDATTITTVTTVTQLPEGGMMMIIIIVAAAVVVLGGIACYCRSKKAAPAAAK